MFWLCLSRVWNNWRSSLVIVQPATVVAWHREGFKLDWRWKSRPRAAGRPAIDRDIRELIHRVARDNPTWGRRRIQAEPRTFLEAHLREIAAVDFFVVPTLTFHHRVERLGLHQLRIAPHAIRRERVDHFIVLNDRHLRHCCALTALTTTPCGHISRSTPTVPILEKSSRRPHGRIVAITQVGDLHHHHRRVAGAPDPTVVAHQRCLS